MTTTNSTPNTPMERPIERSTSMPTSARLDFATAAPEAFKAVLALGASWSRHLDPTLVEIVQIRVSQLNGCAYCLHMHTSDALAAGERPTRLSMVAVWRDAAHLFTPEEVTALALAEELTRLDSEGVTDGTYQDTVDVFGVEGTAHLIAQILTINTWNRIARATAKVAGTDERRR